MKAAEHHLMEVWAHLAKQREEVRRQAQQHAGSTKLDIQEKGPLLVQRGTLLTVRFCVKGLRVEPKQDTILWLGEIANARFVVTVPPQANPGDTFSGRATIHACGGVVAVISFILRVEATPLPSDLLESGETHCRRAFASYASEDQRAVLGRIQGMKKAVPDMDVFFARTSLQSGELWPERLRSEILTRDVFYLFWSKAAKSSHWVEREWRLALGERGIEYIDPVPLVSPQEVPPPAELADELHFDDWMLAYMNSEEGS